MKLHGVVQALLSENEQFKFVAVCFPTSSKEYIYKTTLEVAAGDKVVVDTPSGMQVVVVKAVLPIDEVDLNLVTYAWVVCKVDTDLYTASKAKEDELTQELRKKQRKHFAQQAADTFLKQLPESDQQDIKALVRL